MSRICISCFTAALLLCIEMASAQTECPDFVHRENITQYVDSPGVTLPVTGTVVAGRRGGGLYVTSLGENNPTLVPNTQSDNLNSTQITEDGQWVLYNSGGPKIIRIDGEYKTTVPSVSHGGEGCCTFWWNAPSGNLEVAYRTSDNRSIHAVPVTLSANAAPTFGSDHTIAQFDQVMEFTMGVAGTHIYARINTSSYGPQMVTIPNNGNGTATNADFWAHTNGASWGCKCTISHDGSITCHNPGYDQWVGCVADEFVLLRHKSFVLLPFQEKGDPSLEWQNVLMKEMGVSVNWAPEKYLFLNPDNPDRGASAGTSNFWSDFKNWCYTNNNEYIVGDADCLPYKVSEDSCAGENMPDSGTIWLVHYPTNTWTMVMRLDGGQRLAFPAVWIDQVTGCKPSPGSSRLEYRGVPSRGSEYIIDIRGRRVAANGTDTRKLTPGIYYIVSPKGVMRRLVVGR